MTLEPGVIVRRLQSLRETLRRLEPLASTSRAEFVADVACWLDGGTIEITAQT